MTWTPTTDELLNLDGVRRRTDTFRFELLDRSEELIGEIHPDRSRPPSISNDTGTTIPRRLRGLHLPSSEMQDINVVSDRVRVVMELQNGAEFSLGIFLWADDSRPERSWGAERFSELSDKTIMLDQPLVGSVGWPPGAGGSQGVTIGLLFFALGVLSLDEIAEIGEEALVEIPEPVSWPPATKRLQAMIDFGGIVGFSPPWFDRGGRLHQVVPPDPEEVPPIVTYRAGGHIVANSILRSDNLLTAPNVSAVYDSGPSAVRVGRFELPASVQHSVANRGFEVALVESRQGISSQTQANRAAKSLMSSSGVAFDWVQFTSTADPRHDTWDVIALQLEDEPVENWLETSWEIECRSGGPMTHQARKVHTDG